MEHALPFRSASVPCPRCPAQALTTGPLHHCPRCAGTWIDEQSLADRVGSMKDAPPQALDWSIAEDRPSVTCPLCRRAMDALVVLDIPVDRCPPHGVWFDKGELAQLLERSTLPPVVPGAAVVPAAPVGESVGASVAAEASIEVALTAVEVAVESTSVVGTVLEGVLEVVGAIFSAIDIG